MYRRGPQHVANIEDILGYLLGVSGMQQFPGIRGQLPERLPGAVLLAVSCDAFAFRQEDTNDDRITIEWTITPDDASKQLVIGRRSGLITEMHQLLGHLLTLDPTFAFGQEDTNNDRITIERTNTSDGAAKQIRREWETEWSGTFHGRIGKNQEDRSAEIGFSRRRDIKTSSVLVPGIARELSTARLTKTEGEEFVFVVLLVWSWSFRLGLELVVCKIDNCLKRILKGALGFRDGIGLIPGMHQLLGQFPRQDWQKQKDWLVSWDAPTLGNLPWQDRKKSEDFECPGTTQPTSHQNIQLFEMYANRITWLSVSVFRDIIDMNQEDRRSEIELKENGVAWFLGCTNCQGTFYGRIGKNQEDRASEIERSGLVSGMHQLLGHLLRQDWQKQKIPNAQGLLSRHRNIRSS
ncbi:unnamed protein product [Caenorhabditis nigoni]